MKKFFAFAAVLGLCLGVPVRVLAEVPWAAPNTYKCNYSTATYTMSAYVVGEAEPVHEESETSANNIKAGYIYEYVSEPGFEDYVSEYYNSSITYDLSSLSGINPADVLSATLYLGAGTLTVSGAVEAPTLNYVLGVSTTKIATLDVITVGGKINAVDVTSMIKDYLTADITSAELTAVCASIDVGTDGSNYAKVALRNLEQEGQNTDSYILVTVPEPSAGAAALGVFALAFAALRRRK